MHKSCLFLETENNQNKATEKHFAFRKEPHPLFLVGSVLLIFLVFCVVVFLWVPCCSSLQLSVLWFLVGSVLLISLVFGVVLCFACFHSVSCVPNIASVSGLSFLLYFLQSLFPRLMCVTLLYILSFKTDVCYFTIYTVFQD